MCLLSVAPFNLQVNIVDTYQKVNFILYVMLVGLNPLDARGSRTGVFIGVSDSESEEYWTADPEKVNGYGLTGCCRAMFPNRISYTFDFTGELY
jgi:hypothetical protein